MSEKPVPRFSATNTTAAYQLRYHFGWYTHGRNPSLANTRARQVIEQAFAKVTQAQNYHVLGLATEPVAIRALLSLTPNPAPSEVTRRVKGTLAAAARDELGLQQLWSRGWFLRSVGSCTNDVVRNYIAAQFDHHRATPVEQPELVTLARFHSKADPTRLRKGAHVVFEYNVHFVFVTPGRREFLDPYVAQELIDYWKRVCDKKAWTLWDVEVLWDHCHLFLGLKPAESPLAVALSLMNNSSWFLEQRHGTVLHSEGLSAVWRPAFYAGTAGSATTAQVKAFLQSGMS
ncbi:MAG TPA: IS200/IS605 family transposase [Planctomycetaceae bacterium]|nr:IS200/IS605 family transposase [Planctomycetaceae bacterium]